MTQLEKIKPTVVVGIGASAGGLEAIEQFFSLTPVDNRLAYIVVQHMSPNHTSLIPDLLDPVIPLDVIEAQDGMEVLSNTVYLIRPKVNLTIGNGLIHLSPQRQNQKVNFSIDTFFESLAYEQQKNSIAIVLSGTGSDGTIGLKKIKEYEGAVLVQDPNTAGFAGMPESAIATGMVDKILPVPEMPRVIQEYLRKENNLALRTHADLTILREENAVSLIFSLLKRIYNIDFGDYKLATMLRRIERRVHLSKAENISNYAELLRKDSEEVEILYRELLVEVTHFFRDQEAFKTIASDIITQLIANKEENDQLRVWVPGCATGEEAYSLAILIHEYMALHEIGLDVKIFATDVHQRSLDYASRGHFEEEKLISMPQVYLERYFTFQNGMYAISSEIRRMVIFAYHNLIQDPPFTRLDLISCRNVLIYFRPFVQKRVLDNMNFGLRKDGILFLGPSENTGTLNDEFLALSHRWRIFKKKYERKYKGNGPLNPEQNEAYRLQESLVMVQEPKKADSDRTVRQADWQKALLARYVPSGFLVDDKYNAQHIFGDAGKFLAPSEGRVTISIFDMVRREVQPNVRAALHRATHTQETVAFGGISIDFEDGVSDQYRIVADPIKFNGSEKLYFLVSITPDSELRSASLESATELHYSQDEISYIETLEQELRFAKENLQLTIEELETTNEELQTTNEELMASNEELQSTNEELHSVNEELYTVNSEYQLKINELTKLNNDMKNLQRSSRVKILFLDKFMRIRDFTPEMATTFNLMPHDVGRPIEHLLYNLNMDREELATYVQRVIEVGKPINREVESFNQGRFLLQILPYQLETGALEGVVLYLTDIGGLKTLESEMQKNQKRFQSLLSNIRRPVIYHDAQGNIIQLNSALAGLLDKEANDLIGRNIKSLIVDDADLDSYFEATENNRPTPRITIKLQNEDGKIFELTFDSQPIFDGIGNLIEYQGIGHIVG
ncbi:MAG: chemotaxis protein CheB [Chloroflexota bacterium]